MTNDTTLHIIGGGLAGSEAAWQAAQAGQKVILHEMRKDGVRSTDAHQTDQLAELVCSNSFRSDDAESNAVGVIHAELRQSGSIIMAKGDEHAVPAGGALAVDRHGFSEGVTEALNAHPLIEVVREEINGWPPEDWKHVIIASGPLTSDALSKAILEKTGEEHLAFFDAIAPIVHAHSINREIVWAQSRYDKGNATDYLNCPMTEEQYNAFIDAILEGEKTEFKEWEADTPYFEACLPIEVMAERGRETLRFGPMKPVGLTDPRTGKAAHAVVQLRQDNKLGTLWNIVGFQTKLKYGAQADVLHMIPGLESAEFARLGGIHRNSFIRSPVLLDDQLRLKADPRVRFAGQITGVEGYIESAAIGMLAGRLAAAEIAGRVCPMPSPETAMGSLLGHLTNNANPETFQPMNVNFGLFPPPPPFEITANGKKRKIKGRDRKMLLAAGALKAYPEYETLYQRSLGEQEAA